MVEVIKRGIHDWQVKKMLKKKRRRTMAVVMMIWLVVVHKLHLGHLVRGQPVARWFQCW
jgi:hypothetical protein